MSNGPLCAGTKAGFEGLSKVAPIADAHGARIRAVYVLQIAGAASRHEQAGDGSFKIPRAVWSYRSTPICRNARTLVGDSRQSFQGRMRPTRKINAVREKPASDRRCHTNFGLTSGVELMCYHSLMRTVSYHRHGFPPDIIQNAVWLYFRFPLSFRDVENLLAERGIDVSYETVRRCQ